MFPLNIQCIYWVFFFLRWFFTAAKRALRRNFGSTCGVKRVKRVQVWRGEVCEVRD
jgi:hypothetical protein